MKYKLADPFIDERQINIVKEVLLSKKLVHGEICEQFENALANYLGADSDGVAVTSSCTASLHLALLALGIGKGDGVFVPNFTFPATVNVVERVGAIPIFVDVKWDTYTMDADLLESQVIQWKSRLNLKAIIVVHEFGATVQMNRIQDIAKEHDLLLIEDAACAFGSTIENNKVGLLSDVGCFSFHPRKALTTGEGGLVVSRNPDLIEKVKVLRNHGMKITETGIDFVEAGLNYRMTNFQAALGLIQLEYFDSWIQKRRTLQNLYRHLITSPLVIHPVEQEGHTWQSYMLLLDERIDRNRMIEELKIESIEANYGAYAVLDTTYYHKKYGKDYIDPLVVSETLYRSGLCLPLHQGLEEEDIVIIAQVFKRLLESW